MDKSKSNKKSTLIEGDDIISQDNIVAETFNEFFANTVKKNLDIEGYNEACTPNDNWNFIENSIEKLKNHPSILQIKKKCPGRWKITFSTINEHDSDTHNSW